VFGETEIQIRGILRALPCFFLCVRHTSSYFGLFYAHINISELLLSSPACYVCIWTGEVMRGEANMYIGMVGAVRLATFFAFLCPVLHVFIHIYTYIYIYIYTYGSYSASSFSLRLSGR
jgi:hypothetical protein